jgi:hypothetical protein
MMPDFEGGFGLESDRKLDPSFKWVYFGALGCKVSSSQANSFDSDEKLI